MGSSFWTSVILSCVSFSINYLSSMGLIMAGFILFSPLPVSAPRQFSGLGSSSFVDAWGPVCFWLGVGKASLHSWNFNELWWEFNLLECQTSLSACKKELKKEEIPFLLKKIQMKQIAKVLQKKQERIWPLTKPYTSVQVFFKGFKAN